MCRPGQLRAMRTAHGARVYSNPPRSPSQHEILPHAGLSTAGGVGAEHQFFSESSCYRATRPGCRSASADSSLSLSSPALRDALRVSSPLHCSAAPHSLDPNGAVDILLSFSFWGNRRRKAGLAGVKQIQRRGFRLCPRSCRHRSDFGFCC
jgi:hypothetical protein